MTKPIITKSRVSEIQDQEFEAFFATTYPDGIKRASFMARLANGRYVYHKDLGGLCNIYNEYGYEVFDTLINII
uniref:Uncharacterized protein n=1 Tax=Rhizophagus irregularis (strain DAOM 181602 / DAOM 197198 / MUCL 43194) TaxID=747089 RepID=U9UGQ8_RHIID